MSTQKAGPSSQIAASPDYTPYVSGGTPDLDSADINVGQSYAGYATGRNEKPSRAIVYTGGAVVVTKRDGTEETLPASMAGIVLPIEVFVINGSDVGTTATAVLVMW